MLGMQGLVAQHYSVHMVEQTGQHQDSHEKALDACEICIVAKTFAQIIDAHAPALIAAAIVDYTVDIALNDRLPRIAETVYAARAPPALIS